MSAYDDEYAPYGSPSQVPPTPPTERDGIKVGDRLTLRTHGGSRWPVEVIGFNVLDCDIEVRWLGLSPLGRDTATVCRRDFAEIIPDVVTPSQADRRPHPDVMGDSAHSRPSTYSCGSGDLRERSQPTCEAAWGCEEGTPAVMLVGATCERGHDLRRHLCQPCFDFIWGLPGQPGCSRCSYDGIELPATLLEAIRV